MLFGKKRKLQKEIQKRLDEMAEVIENLKFSSNPQSANKPEDVLYFLDLFANKSREALKILTPEDGKAIYKKYVDHMLKVATSYLTREFTISDHEYDSTDININNNIYVKKVRMAATFFGEKFLDQNLWVYPENRLLVSNAVCPPFPVKDSFFHNSTDLTDLVVLYGKPIPKMNGRYNKNLPYIIEIILRNKYQDIIIR